MSNSAGPSNALDKTGAKKGIDLAAGAKRRTGQGISLRSEVRKQALSQSRHRGNVTMALPADTTNPMAYDDALDPNVLPAELVPHLASMLSSTEDPEAIKKCVDLVFKFCTRNSPPLESIAAYGCIPKLIQILAGYDQHPELAEQALRSVAALAGGSRAVKKALIGSEGGRALVFFLSAAKPEWRSLAALSIGLISADASELRNHFLSLGALEALGIQLQNATLQTPDGLQNIIFAVSGMVKSKPFPSMNTVKPLIPYLVAMVGHHDEKVVAESLWALSYISDGDDRIGPVIETGILPTACRFLRSSNVELQLSAIRLIGNFCQGDDEFLDLVLQSGAMNEVPTLMRHPNVKIRKETSWMVSNVAAGTRPQIQWLCESGLLLLMVEALKAPELSVRREAGWTFTNVMEAGTVDQVRYLTTTGFLENYGELLKEADMKIVESVLKGISYLLANGEEAMRAYGLAENPYKQLVLTLGIVDQVEKCSTFSCNKVADEADAILEEYFVEDRFGLEGEETPRLEADHYAFGAPGTSGAGFGGLGSGNPNYYFRDEEDY
jgi:importin subunit alpha-1